MQKWTLKKEHIIGKSAFVFLAEDHFKSFHKDGDDIQLIYTFNGYYQVMVEFRSIFIFTLQVTALIHPTEKGFAHNLTRKGNILWEHIILDYI